MTTTIAFSQAVWDVLSAELSKEHESAWVLLARQIGDAPNDLTLLVREVIPVPASAYEAREWDRLSITPEGWLPAFIRADSEDCVPIFMHTHPNGYPEHSEFDYKVDDELARVAAVRLGQGTYGSFILSGSPDEPDFAGRVKAVDTEWTEINRVRIVGEQLSILTHDNNSPLPLFDRHVRAFGEDGQKLLKHLRVGIVGAGGTGSAVLEQLARLGVGDIVIIDPQELADTNVTRVYGSSLDDQGRPKVAVAADNVGRVGLGTVLHPVQGTVRSRRDIEALVHCDIIFGCTDDNASRVVLSRMPQSLLQLFIDCGVIIDSRNKVLFDIFARVTIVTPVSACLMCTEDVDPQRAAMEALPEKERVERQREGYAPDLDTPDPSVITFTTLAASLAVNELLSRVFGYVEENSANRLVARIASREFSRSRHSVRGSHRCGDAQFLASGMQKPFLGYGWPNEQ